MLSQTPKRFAPQTIMDRTLVFTIPLHTPPKRKKKKMECRKLRSFKKIKNENFRTFVLKHLSCFLLMNSTNIRHAPCLYMAKERVRQRQHYLRLRTEVHRASVSGGVPGEDTDTRARALGCLYCSPTDPQTTPKSVKSHRAVHFFPG